MTEHRGTSFYNSCVKVPVNPCNMQPTPSYERYGSKDNTRDNVLDNKQKTSFAKHNQLINALEIESRPDIVDTYLEFLESIPDYDQVHNLTDEQFKQKVYHLKQRQKFLLKNLQSTLAAYDNACASEFSAAKCNERLKNRVKNDRTDLTLSGVKCNLEESRCSSPIFLKSYKCNELPKGQHTLRNRCNINDKEDETTFKEAIHSPNKIYSTWDKLNSGDDMESDIDSIETRSLPASITKEWQPTVPKPFSFTVKEEAEKYMTQTELDDRKDENIVNKKCSPYRKRRVKPIPLSSKIPLYDKLLAEKEERSRMNREESALNLMSQVRPFRLECDRRAWRSLAKSSPEICSKRVNNSTHFKAKPVPKNLFSTEVYDRMLEDEYYRQLQKRVRAAQLMRSSSLPPSMARRERVMSACSRLQNTGNSSNENNEHKNVSELSNTSVQLEKCKSVMSLLPLRGNNLAAILRCQVSREKLERDISEKMEEKRKEQAAKFRESLIGRNPAWRALRFAARYEHERDLNTRSSRRRHEAREQAERHRAQMETMLNRVTQIPTLFERHSQGYKLSKTQQKVNSLKPSQRKKKRKQRRQVSSYTDSYMDYENVAKSDSGSSTSSSPSTFLPTSQSSKASNTSVSHVSGKSAATKSQNLHLKGIEDRSRLKVSINETAKLIGGPHKDDKLDSDRSLIFRDHEFNGHALEIFEHDIE